MDRSRIDSSITTLVDLTGACERIFKSPVPLVYTRHTSRFLALFLIFLPFGLWPTMGDSWNHWATVPAADVVAFFLLGIEEIGIQIEEPFSILPIEAFCNGAIAATIDELVSSTRDPSFDVGVLQATAQPRPAVAMVHEAAPVEHQAEPAHVVEEPKAVEPKAVEPKVVEPKAVEPKAVEPRAIEPKAIEPKAMQPLAVQPLTMAKWEPGSFEKLWAASK
eukprot:scaffold6354_cov126-Isochrysis_galbana.AAC.14